MQECSNCGYKLSEDDIEENICPDCGMQIEELTLEEEGGAAWMFQELGLPLWG